jgi:predicted XRE-type DNA-binding protein
MKAHSGLMMAIGEAVNAWNVTQAETAKRLGITQTRLNDLLRGRTNEFSPDALMTLAIAAELKVEWRVEKPAA